MHIGELGYARTASGIEEVQKSHLLFLQNLRQSSRNTGIIRYAEVIHDVTKSQGSAGQIFTFDQSRSKCDICLISTERVGFSNLITLGNTFQIDGIISSDRQVERDRAVLVGFAVILQIGQGRIRINICGNTDHGHTTGSLNSNRIAVFFHIGRICRILVSSRILTAATDDRCHRKKHGHCKEQRQ